ncbi:MULTISPECIES: potassium-transporting ATPase subunit KdpC [unclassified Acinetobacter]|uniref:potassium-transporting ATPase subunit KdpC n=1 Tax=unclassified Acinetobacter TaxID=196816 RepID=UPI0018A9859B|nr:MULTISPECIES: potassium-transporting ATPase subunit KdpC [unclassified Acinetobacter]MBJ9953009.1 potassium-transporting ATPase subunit KdpC [Acinetobacter baumannii]
MNTETHQVLDLSLSSLIRASIGLTVVALGLCGFVYSSAATGLGQLSFPEQANGSMLIENNQVLGSRLVAQPFQQVQYFQARPSAAHYDPMNMAASNMARTNPELQHIVAERMDKIARLDQIEKSKIPADLVTASGSGIDPDISVQSAMIQVKRVAKARHLTEENVAQLVQEYTTQPTFGIFGQARVNVLALNLALDRLGK